MRQALAEVGFLNSHFRGYGWDHVEWTHRFGVRYRPSWGLPEWTVPCLDHGVRATWMESFFNQAEFDRNDEVYADIRANPAELEYCGAWHEEDERLQMQGEVAAARNAYWANRVFGQPDGRIVLPANHSVDHHVAKGSVTGRILT